MEIKIGKAAPNNEDACLEHHFFDDSVPVQTITGTFQFDFQMRQHLNL